MSALERAWRFDCEVEQRAAGSVHRFDRGAAIYTPDLPHVYDANLIRVDRGLDRTSADELEQLADSLQGELPHRKLVLPDGAGSDRLARELAARGWQESRTVVMRYDGPRERDPARAAAAELVDPRAIRGARVEAGAGRAAEVRRQIAEWTERVGAAAHGRVAAAFADGHVAAFCALLEGDGIGEIDEVTTLEPYRNQGLGNAVVEAALSASLAAGHDLTFLLAADGDWPKAWYTRLGFRTVGRRFEVYRV